MCKKHATLVVRNHNLGVAKGYVLQRQESDNHPLTYLQLRKERECLIGNSSATVSMATHHLKTIL